MYRVGHGEHALALVLERRHDLVGELLAPDGVAAAPGAVGVAALQHEVGDVAVELDAVVAAARTEREEVLAGQRRQVAVQLKIQIAHVRAQARVPLPGRLLRCTDRVSE